MYGSGQPYIRMVIYMNKVGQNRIYKPYLIVCLVISPPKIPYTHRVHMVLASALSINNLIVRLYVHIALFPEIYSRGPHTLTSSCPTGLLMPPDLLCSYCCFTVLILLCDCAHAA